MPSGLNLRVWKFKALPADWNKRNGTGEQDIVALESTVKKVIAAVRQRGDEALIEYTAKFDKTKLTANDLLVTPREIRAAYSVVTKEQISALNLTKNKLESIDRKILQRQPVKSIREGIAVQTMMQPLDSVGCYVPGGQAAYPSTLIMTVTPAKVAGVPRVVVCSPPTENGNIHPLILVAADICGVDEIYKIGGVQAVAALAYGTETIARVKKIVGPGSKYVTAAKVMVSQDIAIDMPAGPSEVLVLADETANPKLVAADMISQAEHGADSVAGLATTSTKIVSEVLEWLEKLIHDSERSEIIQEALSRFGFIITCESDDELVEVANAFAPEHLEIVTQKSMEIAKQITTAGLILLGSYSPVALSDYASGTNHVLPTGGFGNAFSGLSVLDFTRRINIVKSSKAGLKNVKSALKAITEAERLPNHYKAVEARFEKQ